MVVTKDKAGASLTIVKQLRKFISEQSTETSRIVNKYSAACTCQQLWLQGTRRKRRTFEISYHIINKNAHERKGICHLALNESSYIGTRLP
jgi:hypothetical protein